ncbi:plasmid replication protein RepC [Rhizobium alvei]|uniref:Plasmid replication protein RepC n=1 Tax=Rhizobium alvei TaxID=1132659 RepID=A0ABT8YSL7_9HYPH|nr:plasmid replication protein RepC [Rhizobium alvei]MDO6966576.1 plasmid replication protein RepC [Rhizobium alvei]
MDGNVITTPFGRRGVTIAALQRHYALGEQNGPTRADKWKLFRDIGEARELLGLTDRAMVVLNALLSFFQDSELSRESGLVVFPSNAQLSLRAHGISGTTLRRQLALLVETGLIERRDSPNGKRYARRDEQGAIDAAFGFSLEPLLVRAAELAALAQEAARQRLMFRKAKDMLTVLRRDARKLISAGLEQASESSEDELALWLALEERYIALVATFPRRPDIDFIEKTSLEMGALKDEAVKLLENKFNLKKMDANDHQSGAHKQNSNTDSIHELEPLLKKEQADEPEQKSAQSMAVKVEGIKNFPLAMVLRACPQIADYGPGGAISNWRDMMAAAVVVRSMLGVSPSAYEAASHAMGPENAAVAIACILERAGHIQSAGGYLRDLTARTERGEFSLGPMLMALLRTNGQSGSLRAG